MIILRTDGSSSTARTCAAIDLGADTCCIGLHTFAVETSGECTAARPRCQLSYCLKSLAHYRVTGNPRLLRQEVPTAKGLYCGHRAGRAHSASARKLAQGRR